MMIDETHIGSSLEDFLKEEGQLEESRQIAAKRVLAWQLQQAMESQHLSKVEMAKRMQTSRSQLDRLLDPDNDKVQLDTLNRAAAIVGKRLKIELIDNISR
jgi:antitoxin HicB